MNKLVVLATICLIGVHGKPQEFEREVSSLQSLQNQPQASASWNMQQNLNPYGGAQGFANPYMRGSLNFGQPSYAQPQPSSPYPPQPSYPYSYPQMPQFGLSGNLGYGGYSIGGSAGYYPNNGYGYYPNNGGQVETSTSKPNYNDDDKEYDDVDEEEEGPSKVEVVNDNSGLNWNQPSWGWNQPSWNGGMQWNNNGGPNWSSSYTPVGGGCYNRCKPQCSFRPPIPAPPPPPPPRPRPRPLPMPQPRPQPQPARPNYGCRSVCRPMCNSQPRCGGGAQMNGNTMTCGMSRPNYNQGWNQYGGMNYNSQYGGGMTTLPAKVTRSQPKAAAKKSVITEVAEAAVAIKEAVDEA